MPRSDVHRDGLARELGATHYQSAHEKAAADLAGSHRPERRGARARPWRTQAVPRPMAAAGRGCHDDACGEC